MVPDEFIVCGAESRQGTEVRTERRSWRQMEEGGALVHFHRGNRVSGTELGVGCDFCLHYPNPAERGFQSRVSQRYR